MKRRMLEGREVVLYKKAVKKWLDELEDKYYEREYLQMKLEKGLDYAYRQNKKVVMKDLKNVSSLIKEKEEFVKTYDDHLENGVPQKEGVINVDEEVKKGE